MDYTICVNAVKSAKGGNQYSYDMLMPFTLKSNAHRVVINDKILEKYKEIADDIIRTWITGFTIQKCFKKVECDAKSNVFFETCLKVHGRRLIASEKEDYTEQEHEQACIMNKDEAIIELKPQTAQVNQIGENNQYSAGDKSLNNIE